MWYALSMVKKSSKKSFPAKMAHQVTRELIRDDLDLLYLSMDYRECAISF